MKISCLLVFLFSFDLAFSQYATYLGSNTALEGTNSIVTAIEINKTSGEIFLGGFFSIVASSEEIIGLVKYNPNTKEWSQLGAGMFATGVNALLMVDNVLYVGGFPVNGSVGIASWNGTHWNKVANGAENWVFSIVRHPIQRELLYVGGSFQQISGFPAHGIAVYNITNDQFSLLTSDLLESDSPSTWSLLFDPYGNLYVGGDYFTGTRTLQSRNIIMFDGTTWHSLGGGVQGRVLAMTWDNHTDSLLVGGGIDTFGYGSNNAKTNCGGIAYWNPRNLSWTCFGTRLSNVFAFEHVGNDLYIGSDLTRIYIDEDGNFTTLKGFTKWDGSNLEQVLDGANAMVGQLKYWNDVLYVGGYFSVLDNQCISGIAAYHTSGSAPASPPNTSRFRSFGTALDSIQGHITNIVRYKNYYYIGTNYVETEYGSGLIGYNNVTSRFESLGGGVIGQVNAVAVNQTSGEAWIGGNVGVQYWNPTTRDWHTPVNVDAQVWAMEFDSTSSTLFVGGYFDKFNNIATNGTFKIKKGVASRMGKGLVDRSGNGIQGVNAMAYDSYSKLLYVGGTFDSSGDGVICRSVCIYNPATDGYQTTGVGLNEDVFSLAVDSVRHIVYATGRFTATYGNSVALNGIAKYVGGQWLPVANNKLTLDVFSRVKMYGPDLMIGGTFFKDTSGSEIFNYIAIYKADTDTVQKIQDSYGVGLNGKVTAFDGSGHELLIAGEFSRALTVCSPTLVAWKSNANITVTEPPVENVFGNIDETGDASIRSIGVLMIISILLLLLL